MKQRWSILFWLSLATLIGLSWLAVRMGVGLASLMGLGLGGMIAAAVVAFVAMQKSFEHKWPAAVVLVCASPFALDSLRVVFHLGTLVRIIGPSILLAVLCNLATIIAALLVLAAKPPVPPPPPPVPPARVVE